MGVACIGCRSEQDEPLRRWVGHRGKHAEIDRCAVRFGIRTSISTLIIRPGVVSNKPHLIEHIWVPVSASVGVLPRPLAPFDDPVARPSALHAFRPHL